MRERACALQASVTLLFLEFAGKGFGFVQLARNANQEMVAVKMLERVDLLYVESEEIASHSLLR